MVDGGSAFKAWLGNVIGLPFRPVSASPYACFLISKISSQISMYVKTLNCYRNMKDHKRNTLVGVERLRIR